MAEDDPDRRHFAELLKVVREARGLSRAEFGALCGYSASTIKAFETGQRAVYAYHARHFDEAFGLDGIFEHEASRFGKAGYSAAFGAFSDVEQEAEDLYSFEHSTILGLFQTEPYARAILTTYPGATKDQVNERVAARLARQEAINRQSWRPRVWALVDEAALRRCVGDASVMYEQLMHLIELSRLDDVNIQVLPGMVGHAGLLGAFAIGERTDHPSIVYTEDIADGGVTDEPATVKQVMLVFKSLHTRALPADASRDTIARVAGELWKVPVRTGAKALTAVPTAGTV